MNLKYKILKDEIIKEGVRKILVAIWYICSFII
jgi:hypothetical protein